MRTHVRLAMFLAIGVLLSQAGAARAATTFLGGNLNSGGNWSSGLPSSGNPGTIAVDGSNNSTVFNFGSGSVVDMTAGTITSSDGFNVTNGTWNISGGRIITRYFLSNGGSTTFNVSGGTVELSNVSGTQHMGVANNGTLNVSGSIVLDGTQATTGVQTGGTVDIASGWTGSWTMAPYSGDDWKNLFTGNLIEVDGSNIDAATFDSVFAVTDGGKTLSMTGASPPPPPPTPTQFKIDVNDGSSPTETGWTAIGAAHSGNGGTVTVGGVRFDVASADGARNRSGPNALTRDFIYDDDGGQASGLRIYDLPDGIWEAKVWSWDNDFPTAVGSQFVGVGWTAGNFIAGTMMPHPTDPFAFTFDSSTLDDGFGIFTRENNSANRSRFNALQLTRVIIPEPITMLAVGLGLAGLGGYVRKRSRA